MPRRRSGWCVVLGLALSISSQHQVFAQSSPEPEKLLEQADRLAWLRVWTNAAPLYAEAERLFRERGDERNALYAEVSHLRGQLPRLPVPEVSARLAEYLERPLVQADDDPLLRRIMGPRDEPLQIVGVVEDVREDALDRPAQPALYFPYTTYPVPTMTLLIRSSSPPSTLAQAAQSAIREIDPLLAPGRIQPLDRFMREVTAAPRFNTLLLVSFATIAFVLAAVGIYGVTAYAVTQRTSEIGLRLALGARQSDIFRSIIAPGLRLAAAGAFAGVGCAVLLARLLGGLILGVDAQPISRSSISSQPFCSFSWRRWRC